MLSTAAVTTFDCVLALHIALGAAHRGQASVAKWLTTPALAVTLLGEHLPGDGRKAVLACKGPRKVR